MSRRNSWMRTSVSSVGRASASSCAVSMRSAKGLEHGKVPVDHRVEQQVGQIVGARAADAAASQADGFPHRIEHVAIRPLLHGEDPVGTNEDADLLLLDLVLAADHAEDDEEVRVVALDLGPLGDVQGILERERMQSEALAKSGEGDRVAEALHVDPGDAARADPPDGLGGVLGRTIGHVVGVERDHRDACTRWRNAFDGGQACPAGFPDGRAPCAADGSGADSGDSPGSRMLATPRAWACLIHAPGALGRCQASVL